jgi:hypothetical protein
MTEASHSTTPETQSSSYMTESSHSTISVAPRHGPYMAEAFRRRNYSKKLQEAFTLDSSSDSPGYRYRSKVNIIVVEHAPDGSILDNETSILDESSLKNFLANGLPSSNTLEQSDRQYLILVEDASIAMTELLGNHLKIPPEVFFRHIEGGEVIQHSSKCPEGCSHRLDAPQMYLDAGMVKDSSITLTWWRLLFFSPLGHWIERSAMKRHQHEYAALKNIHVPPFPLPTPAERGRLQNSTIQGNVYRPHHAITKFENEIWGASSEERITLFRCPPEASQKCGMIYSIHGC